MFIAKKRAKNRGRTLWKFIKRHVYLVIFLTALGTAGVVWYVQQEIPEAQATHCGFPHYNCGIPCPFGICFTPPPPPGPPVAGQPGTCSLAINASPDNIGASQSSTITITPSPSGTLSGGTFTAPSYPSKYTLSQTGTSATLTATSNPGSIGVNVTASGWTLTSGGQSATCPSATTRVNVGLTVTNCELNSSGPNTLVAGSTGTVTITTSNNVSIGSGTLSATVTGAGSGTVATQNSTGGTIRVTADSMPGTIDITATAQSSNSTGSCRTARHQISVQPLPPPPPPPSCPGASVTLGSSTVAPGGSTTVYAPAGWSNGYFYSNNMNVATIGGAFGNNAATVYANNAGTASIYGTSWRASNGATNCFLNNRFLTVAGSTPSVTLSASTPVLAGDASNLSWSATNVNSGTPCTASSSPAGFWSGTFAAAGSSISSSLTANTTFTVTCTHASGTVQDSKVVTVTVPTMSCIPASQTVATNAAVGVSVTGGVGPFTWSAPGATTTSGSGGSFSTSYSTTGSKTITVTDSASQSSNCSVTVNSTPQTATVTLNALSPVGYNTPTTLTWFSSSTSSCSATAGPGFATSNATSGTDVSTNLTTNPTTFTIVCTSSSGGPPVSDSENVTVDSTPPPAGWIVGNNCSTVAPATTCDTTISWGTDNVAASAQVRLSVNGGAETIFDCATNGGTSPSGSKTATLTVGTTYAFRLYSTADCVSGSSGGSSGDVVLLWDGAASAPSGWTCISCVAGDAYFGVFPRASNTAGGTGGAATVSHTMNFVSAANDNPGGIEADGSGNGLNLSPHTHTWPSASSTAASIVPQYQNLKLIKRTNPTVIPAGAIALFDASVPSGWTAYAALNGVYLRTDTNTSTGGSATHSHTFSATSGTPSSGLVFTSEDLSSGVVGATTGHTHTVNGTTATASNLPPYVHVVFGKASADTAFAAGAIGLFDGSVPPEWTTVSTNSSVYYQRFLMGSNVFGGTGGSDTHNHGGNQAYASGNPSVTAPNNFDNTGGSFDVNFSRSVHTHQVTYSNSNASSLPLYKDIILAKYVGAVSLASVSPVATQTANTTNLTPSNKDIVAVRGNTAPGTDPNTLTASRNDANIGMVNPISSGDTITFAINLVNSSSTSAQTTPITIEDTMYNLAPLDNGTISHSISCSGKCTMPAPTINFDSVLNVLRVSFTVNPTGGMGGLVSPDIWTIRYTVQTRIPPGSNASAFRFLNEAALNGQQATDWMTTPPILFYREVNVPSIQER